LFGSYRVDKQTDKLTNRCRWEHPPRPLCNAGG